MINYMCLVTDNALGMAINLSYALGIHKEETLPMFDPLEQTAR